jgi:hypothetical protein
MRTPGTCAFELGIPSELLADTLFKILVRPGLEDQAVWLYASSENGDDKRVQIGDAGGDDREILGDLNANGGAPGVVGEVAAARIAVEDVELGGDGHGNAVHVLAKSHQKSGDRDIYIP